MSMMTAAAPLIVLVLGTLVYALSGNPKVSKMGEYAYFVGLFWLVYLFAGAHVHF